MFSDETGARHVRSRAASSHLVCCTVIDADTMANASYEANRPWRPVSRYPSSQPWQLCSLRISITRPSGDTWSSVSTRGSTRHPVLDVEHGAEPVRVRLVGAREPEVGLLAVAGEHVAEELAEPAGGLVQRASRLRDGHGVLGEVRKVERLEQAPPVRVRVGTHAALPFGGELAELGDETALLVEELVRPVAPHPLLELAQMVRVAPVRSPAGPDGRGMCLRRGARRRPWGRSSPSVCAARWRATAAALRSRVARAPSWICADRVEAVVEGRRELAMDRRRVVALDEMHVVPIAVQDRFDVLVVRPPEDGRARDLVAVEMQDGQHGAVAHGIEEVDPLPRSRRVDRSRPRRRRSRTPPRGRGCRTRRRTRARARSRARRPRGWIPVSARSRGSARHPASRTDGTAGACPAHPGSRRGRSPSTCLRGTRWRARPALRARAPRCRSRWRRDRG